MRRFFLLSSFLFLSLYISAQLANKIEYAPATIVFADGHAESFAQVKMPWGINPVIAYSTPERSLDSRESFRLKDIDYIRFWNEGSHTETTIYRLQMKPYSILGKGHWGILIVKNDWGALYRCYQTFGLDENGDVVGAIIYENSMGPYLDTPVLIGLIRSGEEEGDWVAYQHDKKKAKWIDVSGKRMIRYIEDSRPDLAEQIREKELKADDLPYIVYQMGE